jgi:RNA polymerase sigma-70 factor (ECF subfamily)
LLNLLRDPTDQAAWTTFVVRYGPKIACWCRQWRLQQASVEDVTQNVLTTLVRRLRTFTYDPQRGTFRGWLKTVTDHAVQAYLKSAEQNGRGTGDSAVLHFLQSCEAREDLHKTLAEVYDLELFELAKKRVQLRVSPRDWKIYQDLAFDGRLAATVAEEHHLTVQAVLMAKCRVKKKLREEIQFLEGPGAEPREG